MFTNKIIIPVETTEGIIELTLYGENSEQTIVEVLDAIENGEAPIQIKEGNYYEYKIEDGFFLQTSEIVTQSNINTSSGRILPNIYVGTLSIDVFKMDTEKKSGEVKLEVQSVKTTYREDYRCMLEEISEKCTDLLLQYSSLVSQFFEVDFSANTNILYQRFAFIKSILDSAEFNDSVHKIISSPVTRWRERETVKDIRSLKRFNSSAIRQLSNVANRYDLPEEHSLVNMLGSVPSKLKANYKIETVDTPENRFVKHALISFQSFCNDFKTKVKYNNRIKQEAALLEDKLEQHLSHSIFKEISNPITLPLNSPVLQRKEGYREILRVWLMLDLAAKLVWHGGNDVYSGNKKNVAILYEYWVFFKLLEIVKEVFKIETLTIGNLIRETEDGLGLKLKQGEYLPINGIYVSGTRKLNIEFSYNKTFSGDNEYPEGGSWTRNLRPDYTLSIWPFGIKQEQAEREELIVHLHFDAKYKIEMLQSVFGKNDDLDKEKEEQNKGTYKRADLLKMHTYKDAIRRTAGAYILYPGTDEMYTKSGFHELIPGLGAFAIRPSKNDDGSYELKQFLYKVLAHFMNRASQREKISYKTYETYKDRSSNELNESLPETYGHNRNLIPDETFVLIGYYKDLEHYNWIIKKGLYNARAEDDRGSLRLGLGEVGAAFLLLHTKNEIKTTKLLKIVEKGPRVFSKRTLLNREYPGEPSQLHYLVYKVEEANEAEFYNKVWDISKLEAYRKGRASVLPFSVTLTELMSAISKI